MLMFEYFAGWLSGLNSFKSVEFGTMANVWHDITGLPDLKGEDGHHHRLPERAPRNGITVVVAGAGIAGMAAALELWRKGMDVQILERTQKFSIAGASGYLEDTTRTSGAT